MLATHKSMVFSGQKCISLVWLLLLLGCGWVAQAQKCEFATLQPGPNGVIDTTGWDLVGKAYIGRTDNRPPNGEIILVEDNVPGFSSGAAFFRTPINLSVYNKWFCEFEFRIYDQAGLEGIFADGIAFCYLDAPPVGYQTGGGIGIPAGSRGLKVILDTYNNNCDGSNQWPGAVPKIHLRWAPGYDGYSGECDTSDGQKTRINNDSSLSFIRNWQYQKCRIEYDRGAISVYFNDNPVPYITGFKTFDFPGYFGFTASTAGYMDRHSIRNVRIFVEMDKPDAGKAVSGCPGTSVNLGASGVPQYSYRWTPAIGLDNPASPNPRLLLTNPAERDTTITYRVESFLAEWPACTNDDVVEVKLLAEPKIDFRHDTLCGVGGQVPFVNLTRWNGSPAPASMPWRWDFGDPAAPGNTATAMSPSRAFSGKGPFNVKLETETPNGCKASFTKQVTPYTDPPLIKDFNWQGATCRNNALKFSADVTDPSYSYEWKFGDGEQSTDPTPSHSYKANGVYEVTLTIKKALCPATVLRKNITIDNRIQFTIGGSTEACLNAPPFALQTVQVTSQSPGTGQYSGPGVSGGNSFDPGAAGIGAHPIAFTYQTQDGCRADTSFSMQVLAAPAPDFSFAPDDPACPSNGRIRFTNLTNGTPPATGITWRWELGDGNTDTRRDPVHAYATAGDYVVRLIATNDAGCSADRIRTVRATTAPLAASFNYSGTTCIDQPLQFTSTLSNPAGVPVRYEWNFGDGSRSTDANPLHRYRQNGIYSVSLKVSAVNDVCLVAEQVKSVQIRSDISFNIAAQPPVCFSDPAFDLRLVSPVGGTPGTGTYSGPGVANNRFTPSAAGEGNFRLQYAFVAANGCRADTSFAIQVQGAPRVSAGPDKTMLEGMSVVLEGQVPPEVVSYSWQPPRYIDNPNSLRPVVNPPTDTWYVLTGRNSANCSSSDSVKVSVLDQIKIPNAFSPNGDGINDVWNIPFLNLFPECVMRVFDRYGREVFRSVGYARPWDGTRNGQPVPVGVYYYVLDMRNNSQLRNGSVTVVR